MYDKFNVLLRNNEHFDQKLHQILLFNIFLNKQNCYARVVEVSYLDC